LSAQNYWVQRAGSSTIDEASSISLDDSSNAYTTGYFTSTASFGPLSITATGISDIFVTKTNSLGIFQWAVRAGGAGSCRGLAIKADGNGNSYVTGFYYGSATFGSTTITSAGSQDVFIAKYDRNGKLLWVATAGGPQADIGNAINIDNSGNVLVTGEFAGSATFGSTTLVSTKGAINVFTTKLDGNGNFLWAKSGVGIHTDRGLGIAADPSGNVYVMGQFSDTITFDFVHYSTLYDAIFLVKYNSTGNEQWFTKAGGGTFNIANGIAVDKSSNVYLTGSFTGTLSFFVSSVVTLSNKYPNRIFVAKYTSAGALTWDVADGSSSAVTSNAIALDGSGNPYIIGNFECVMNGYADDYGQGTFNTVGYWDNFVSEYSSSNGAWQWSRQIGGHLNNYGNGIAVSSLGDIYTAGSFDQDMIVTSGANFIGYKTNPINCNNAYCSDNYYGDFQSVSTSGNLDIFIARPIDLTRQPYDFYDRNGSACLRPQVGVCINVGCPDTVTYCGGGAVYAVSNTCPAAGPNFTDTWSTKQVGGGIYVSKSGWYTVTETSVDGCIVSKDSIYVVINPLPAQPNISDNVIVNTNATSPLPIHVCEKSVILTGGGYGSNSYSWSNGSTATTQSITVTKSGTYCFNVKDAKGCTNQTCVLVTIDTTLPKIIPKLICLTCNNDTVRFCKGNSFSMFTYDSISNPLANTSLCIPPSATIKWIAGPGSITYTATTYCPGSGINSFTPQDSGWFQITDTIIQENYCDTIKTLAHDSVFVRLYPIPAIGGLSVTGGASICPGDSVILIAKDTMSFVWSNGSTKDTIKVGVGSYSISSSVTNIYGCSASASAGASVTLKTPPTIVITASSGVICPNDSLELICTGGIGNYQWQGPSGNIGGDTSIIYVKQPGNYYCVVSDTSYCNPVLSNTILINLYATPQLIATATTLCPGDTAKIVVFSSVGSTIQWQPPLSGNDTVKYFTAAGTYFCNITSCGLTSHDSIKITMSTPAAKITVSGPTTFCISDSVILTGNNGVAQYNWTPGAITNQSITVYSSGTYVLTTTDANGCRAKDSTLVDVTPNNTQPPLVSDTAVCPGTTVTLTAQGGGTIEWYSILGGTPIATGNTFTTPPVDTVLTYYVTDDIAGCKSKNRIVSIDTTDCNGVFIPNVFTPNGDGKNDFFQVIIKGAKCYNIKIYNRWGVLVYEGGDALSGWNGIVQKSGLPASDGTYYYIINYCNYENVPAKRDGFLTLIR